MFEIRTKEESKNSNFRTMALNSKKLPQNQKRLASLLVEQEVSPAFRAHEIWVAFKESPVWDKAAINKVHVTWDPAVTLDGWRENPGGLGVLHWEPNLPADWPVGRFRSVFKRIHSVRRV